MFAFILGTVVLVPMLLLTHIHTYRASVLGLTPLEDKKNLGLGAAIQRSCAQILHYLFPSPLMGLTMKSEVPFGPFLIASCLIFWFSGLYDISLPLIG